MPNSKDFNTSENNEIPFIITHKIQSIIIIALLIFILAFTSWWRHIYNNPENVFNGMLKNNLSTVSVTRETTSDDANAPQNRVEQLSFVPNNSTHSLVTLEQKAEGTDNKVTSETIGTLKEDYNRYISIQTNQKNKDGKPLDYKPVQNIWGKSDPDQEQAQYFSQSALGLIMFANLDGNTRNEVLNTLRDKKAYDVQYKDVKPLRINGKSALVIPVKVNVSSYVSAVKIVAKQIGLGDMANLDPEAYKDQPPIDITLTIDKLSRQLMIAKYGGQQSETYTAYGLTTPVQLPQKTISASELQQKIQEIK